MAIGMVDEDEQGRALPKVIEGIPLNIDGNRTWFDGDVLIDGTVAVDNVLQRDDGSFCLSVTVRRPLSDDTVDVFPGLVMEHGILENHRHLNTWFGQNSNTRASFKDKSPALQAFKLWMFAQPRAEARVQDISVMGYNERLDTFFGMDTFVDRTGVGKWMDPYSTAYTSKGALNVRRGTRTMRMAPIFDAVEPPPERPREAWAVAAQRMLAAWHDNLGVHMGALAFGWMHAAVWRHALVKKERNFPHLYLTGRFQTGKDTMAAALNRAFGVSPHAVTNAGKTTTEKWVRNALGDIGNWPLWLNELRNTPDFLPLCSVIRTAYDLQGSAVLNKHQIEVEFPNRRPLLLVGESLLGGDAEHSRYLILPLRPPKLPGAIVRVETAASECAGLLPHILHDRAIGKEMQDCYDHFLPIFRETGCDPRRGRSFALAMAGLCHVFAPDPTAYTSPLEVVPAEILLYARKIAVENMEVSVNGGVLERFSTMVDVGMLSGDLHDKDGDRISFVRKIIPKPRKDGPRANTVPSRHEWAIWHGGLYEAMARKTRNLPEMNILVNELEAIPGFLGRRKVRWGLKDEVKTCLVYAWNAELPSWVEATSTPIDEDGRTVVIDDDRIGSPADPRVKDEERSLF